MLIRASILLLSFFLNFWKSQMDIMKENMLRFFNFEVILWTDDAIMNRKYRWLQMGFMFKPLKSLFVGKLCLMRNLSEGCNGWMNRTGMQNVHTFTFRDNNIIQSVVRNRAGCSIHSHLLAWVTRNKCINNIGVNLLYLFL